MKTVLLLIVALSSAAAFIQPQLSSSHGISMRQTSNKNIFRFMAEQTTIEKEAVAEDKDTSDIVEDVKDDADLSESEKLLKQVKEAGTAGVISYAAWELAFWALSVPVCVIGYRSVTGHFPNLSDKDDLAQLGAEAFAFVNFARFAVPLRIGLALGTTPWVQENVVDRFMTKDEEEN